MDEESHLLLLISANPDLSLLANPDPTGKSRLLGKLDDIGACPDAIKLDLDDVAVLEVDWRGLLAHSNALRRACPDEVAGQEGSALAEEGDRLTDVEDLVFRVAFLFCFVSP